MRIKTIRSFAFAVALVIAAFGFSWVPAAPAGAATTEANIADGRLFRILTPVTTRSSVVTGCECGWCSGRMCPCGAPS